MEENKDVVISTCSNCGSNLTDEKGYYLDLMKNKKLCSNCGAFNVKGENYNGEGM